MSQDADNQFIVDIEGNFQGSLPEGQALTRSQAASVLVAAIRHYGFEERVELRCKYDGGQEELAAVVEEGSSRLSLRLSGSHQALSQPDYEGGQ